MVPGGNRSGLSSCTQKNNCSAKHEADMFKQHPVFVTVSRIIQWLIEIFTFTDEDGLAAGISVGSEKYNDR
jgi:hypothetical protein